MRIGILRTMSCLGALLFIAGAGPLSAQRWQGEFGGTSCIEVGTKGVQPVSTGGYIAAGASHSPAPDCATRDPYVVKTDDDGILQWSYTYNIDNNLSGFGGAACIRECANGDFIVVGSTGHQNSCCCNPANIFMMRLKSDGSVIWVRSFGTQWPEAASSVIEMTTGDGRATNPGDFVVCGVAYNSDATSKAYMLRVTAGGRLIWDRTYGVKINPATLYSQNQFADLDEDTWNQRGTILAVGTVETNIAGSAKGMLFRINGSDGSVAGDPRVWTLDDLPVTATSVTVLSDVARDTLAGDIAVTGAIHRGFGTNAFIVRFPANGCSMEAKQYYMSDEISIGNDIKEMSNGNLVVTGYGDLSFGFGLNDAILIETNPFDLKYAGSKLNIYGDATSNLGASVMEVTASGSRTAGFVIAGTGNEQLYMIKTDVTGNSFCRSIFKDDEPVTPTDEVMCPDFVVDSLKEWCAPPWTADPRDWDTLLCYSSTRTREPENPNDGVSSIASPSEGSDNVVVPMADDARLASYPNPVRKGDIVKLEYALARSGSVTIDVVDVSGRTVYSHRSDYPAGTNRIPVSTDGWPSGTYLVKLNTNGASATQRITVLDK